MLIRVRVDGRDYYGDPDLYQTTVEFAKFALTKLVPSVKRGENNYIKVEVHTVNASDIGTLRYDYHATHTLLVPYAKMTLDEWNGEYIAAVKKHGSLVCMEAYQQASETDYDALAERFRAALPK